MIAAALAVCGAAWLGGIAVVASTGAAGVRLPGSAGVRLSVSALGVLVALAAAPVLLLVAPAGGIGSAPSGVGALSGGGPLRDDATVPAIAVGLAAAVVGAWAVARPPAGAGARAPGRSSPGRLDALAPALASAAAGIAIGLGVGDGTGSATGERAIALAAGGALVTAAVPAILPAGGRGRLEAVAIAVAGGSLAMAAFAAVPAFVAAAGSVLAAVALVSGRPFASPSLDRLGIAAVAAASVALPLGVAAVGVSLLRNAGAGAASAGGLGGHSALVLATIGAAGAGFLALAERAFHPRGNPVPLLVSGTAVALGTVALLVTDAITACLIAAAAAVLLGAVARAEPDRAGDGLAAGTVVAVGTAMLATVALATSGFARGRTDAAAATGFAGLAIAAAIAVRFGSIPFHRTAIAIVDRAPVGASALATTWLPAGFAFAALDGLAGAIAVRHPLDGPETVLVAVVALMTIVLGAIASLVAERLVHALTYLVVAQTGWAVLVAIAPMEAWPALGGWLPPFAAAALALGGVALVAERGPGPGRVADLGRSAPEASIEILGLLGAGLALLGLPGLPSWSTRAAIGRAAFGDGLAADAIIVVGALLTLAALARLLARPAGPLVLAGASLLGRSGRRTAGSGGRFWRAGRRTAWSGARFSRSGWRVEGPAWREAIDGNVVGLVATGLVAVLAAAAGLGFVR